ncbi:MAG: AAA family ATPase [Spirochaetota bacterium]
MSNANENLLSMLEIQTRYGVSEKEFGEKAREFQIPIHSSGKYKEKVLDQYFTPLERDVYESKVLAISNQKGGEGKTTISLYLTEALSKDAKVLLIDWDPQANASKLLLESVGSSIFECLGYRNSQKRSVRSILHTINPNFDFAPSSISLANLTTPYELGDFSLLKDALKPLRSAYEYIIVDCPPSLGLGLENAFIAADYVLVPIQTRLFSVQGLQDLFATYQKIRSKGNPHLLLLGAILNQYEESRALSGLSVGIKKYFPVFDTIVPRRESIPQSQAKRKMLAGCDKVSRNTFYQLAKEVREKIDVEEE